MKMGEKISKIAEKNYKIAKKKIFSRLRLILHRLDRVGGRGAFALTVILRIRVEDSFGAAMNSKSTSSGLRDRLSGGIDASLAGLRLSLDGEETLRPVTGERERGQRRGFGVEECDLDFVGRGVLHERPALHISFLGVFRTGLALLNKVGKRLRLHSDHGLVTDVTALNTLHLALLLSQVDGLDVNFLDLCSGL
jgi:hypothetical protein